MPIVMKCGAVRQRPVALALRELSALFDCRRRRLAFYRPFAPQMRGSFRNGVPKNTFPVSCDRFGSNKLFRISLLKWVYLLELTRLMRFI
jgi:hypothetical protein